MISYVKGILSEIDADLIVVEAGSIGVGIHVPLSVLDLLPPIGEEIQIFTHLKVADDAMTLYGFLSRGDLSMFRQLINVSGIGPKGALGILSVLTPDELRLAILTADAKCISRAPGVGAKTAQRIILELKDRVSMDDLALGGDSGEKTAQGGLQSSAATEAVQALTQLGYSLSEAGKAVHQVSNQSGMSSEEILKQALKQFRL